MPARHPGNDPRLPFVISTTNGNAPNGQRRPNRRPCGNVGVPRTRRRSVQRQPEPGKGAFSSLRDRLRRPLPEPGCRQVRRQSGSGEGPGQGAVTAPRRPRRSGTGPGGWQQQQQPTATSSDRRQRITLARSAPTWDMSGLKSRRSRISAWEPRWEPGDEQPSDVPDSHGQRAVTDEPEVAN